MRVIAGEFRGRRLRAPEGAATRPTSDRVREALFSVLAPRLEGAAFLDAYAGSGAVGIEALSRGAREAVFVESGRAAARTLRANLESLGVTARARVIVEPFARAAPRLGREGISFDLIFLDPPYGPAEIALALRLCSSGGLLRPGGLLVAEHETKRPLPEREGGLRRRRALRYGGTTLSLFEPAPPDARDAD